MNNEIKCQECKMTAEYIWQYENDYIVLCDICAEENPLRLDIKDAKKIEDLDDEELEEIKKGLDRD